ncbi:MAG: hypothetical protein M3367_03075 [Acidobacteriota bacterium]|nr:hypothetical protein [Acidobacteriota bacterium]
MITATINDNDFTAITNRSIVIIPLARNITILPEEFFTSEFCNASIENLVVEPFPLTVETKGITL